MPFVELPDDVQLDHEQPAEAPPQAMIAPSRSDDVISHLQALYDSGASKEQLLAYAQANGINPGRLDNIDNMIAYRDKGGRGGRFVPQGTQAPAVTDTPPPGFQEVSGDIPLDGEEGVLGQIERGAGLAGRAALRGFGQLTDLVAAPLKAVQDIGNMIAPDLVSPAANDKYTQAADQLGDTAGLPTPRNTAERINDAALAGATGGLMTAGAANAAAPASQIAKMVAGAPSLEMIGGAGAGAAGQTAKEEGAGPVGQLAASLAGGALAPGATKTVGSAFERVLHSEKPSALLAAFQRQQVQPMAAQVGGFKSKMMTGGAKATLGGLPLAAAAEKSIATAKAARDRIAAAMGLVTDDTGAGQAAQRGVRSFMETTAAKASKLYDAIPIANDQPTVLANTRRALAELNQGLESNSELSAQLSDGRLKNFELALTPKTVLKPGDILPGGGRSQPTEVKVGGNLSWADLKAFRSYIGELAGRPTMQESTSKEALQRLYAGLSEDMRATAAKQGPDALRKFERANSFYRASQNRIESTLKLILGNDYQKSPEGAFQQIDKWAREGGDAARLARVMRSLPEDEAATVRATIFSRLGRANPGHQGADVDTFSPASFGTQWAKLDHRAKSVLFPGVEYRQSLDDIARIAEAMKGSEKFANTSGTALAERIGKNLLGATVVGYILHPHWAVAGEGVGYAAGHLLASPRFARWVASAPNKPVGAATLAHINRLTAIAQSEPAIANEVLALQQRLAEAFRPQQLAAEPEQDRK